MTQPREHLDRISTDDLFKRGNFAEVARRADETDWRTHAARGVMMVGRTPLTHFDKVDTPEADFSRAVANWINGDEETAARLLEKEASPPAKRLLALIRKPTIRCLTQLNWHRSGAQDLLTGISSDPKFSVQNISFHKDDLPNAPYADIRRYYSPKSPPDLFLCQMAEWHVIPLNLDALPCPAIGQTSDYDLHIQAIYPWLQCFDALIAEDQLEWLEVGGLTKGTRIETFPKCFGIPLHLPEPKTQHRPLDFFVSGSVFHPYWPEKSKLFFDLIMDEEIEYRFVQGFLPKEAYHYLSSSAKTSVSVIRHPGAMPTRALESLAMGSAVLVQEESSLTLYGDESHGIFTYNHLEDHALNRTMRRVLDNWERVAASAENGAEMVRAQFSLPCVASQYFRFAVYLAAMCDEKKGPPSAPLFQKRLTIHTGFYPEEASDRTDIRNATLARLKDFSPTDPHPFNLIDMTREILVYLASDAAQTEVEKALSNAEERDRSPLYKSLLSFFDFGIKRWPRSLVLRFNLLRTEYHFGARDAAQRIAEEILATSPDTWHIHPLEDVMPCDFFNDHFNYRGYFDAVTDQLAFDASDETKLINMILASVHFYLGNCAESLSHLEAAYQMDEQFPYYALAFANALFESGDARKREQAYPIFATLCRGSVVIKEAFPKLELLQMTRNNDRDAFRKLQDRMSDFAESTSDIQSIGAVCEEAYSEFFQMYDFRKTRRKISNICGDYSVTVVLYSGDIGIEHALTALALLSFQTACIEVFFLHHSIEEAKSLYQSLDISIDTVHFIETEKGSSNIATINDCIKKAAGEFIIWQKPGQSLDDNSALEYLASALKNNESASLAYGDYRLIESQQFDHIDKATHKGIIIRPNFSRQALFSLASLPDFAMWRRSVHERFGFFEQNDPAAFWLKIGLNGDFIHVPKLLGSYNTYFGECALWPSGAQKKEWKKTSSRHWPDGWAEPVPIHHQPILPHFLSDASIICEARWLFSLGFISLPQIKQALWYTTAARELIAKGDAIMGELLLLCLMQRERSFLTPKFILAELKKLMGDADAFEENLTALASANPIRDCAFIRLGVFKAGQNDIEGAIRLTESVCETEQPNYLAMANLANLHVLAENFEASIPYLEYITREKPDDIEGWQMLALACKKLGRIAQGRLAQNHLKRLQRSNPLS